MAPHHIPPHKGADRLQQRPAVVSLGTEIPQLLPYLLHLTRELPDSILLFPASNQPVSETTLKYILVSLRGTLHADIVQLTKHFTGEIHAIGTMFDHIDNKMDEFAHTINDLVDTHDDNTCEQTWIKAKLADLEHHSRSSNLKIRGILETEASPICY